MSLVEIILDFYGVKASDTKALIMQSDLEKYDEKLLMGAWASYRSKDVTGRMPTIAQLIENIQDGRPSTHEAWSMIPRDNIQSCFWTEETRIAFGSVYKTMEEEKTNSWFTFKEKYEELVRDARSRKIPVKWSPSFGNDLNGQFKAIKEAVEKNRISLEFANQIFPHHIIEIDSKNKQIVISSKEDW